MQISKTHVSIQLLNYHTHGHLPVKQEEAKKIIQMPYAGRNRLKVSTENKAPN
jgi:hypothetical protein